MWNAERFKNPISISRKETMKLARIGSPNTYVQALRELHKHKFIRYDPSFDKTKGSLIILYRFDTISCTPSVSKMSPSINIQTTHSIEENKKSISNPEKDNNEMTPNSKNQLTAGADLKSISFQVPPLQHIQIYFHQKGHPEAEAERFFNYYQSNGWLVGGKTPMKDWKAAARNWMLNIKKFDKSVIERSRDAKYKPVAEQSPKQPPERSRRESRSKLRPITPPPSSTNYDEPL